MSLSSPDAVEPRPMRYRLRIDFRAHTDADARADALKATDELVNRRLGSVRYDLRRPGEKRLALPLQDD